MKHSKVQRMGAKLAFNVNSLKEYILDILYMRKDPLSFKTAEFCKRNFNRIRSTLSHILYELRKVKNGFGKLKNDILFVLGVKTKTVQSKYSKRSYF